MAIRSSSRSWPTMVRLTSNSTDSRGNPGLNGGPWWPWGDVMGGPSSAACLSCRACSHLRTPTGSVAGGAERGADRNGEADAGPRVVVARVGDGDDDAHHGALVVDQRAARAAGVDRGVELDQPGELARVGLGGALQAGDDTGGGAVGQAELVAD